MARDTKTWASDHDVGVQAIGVVFNTAFRGPERVEIHRDYAVCDSDHQKQFLTELQHVGVRLTSRGTCFPSLAYTDADIDLTLEAARGAFAALG